MAEDSGIRVADMLLPLGAAALSFINPQAASTLVSATSLMSNAAQRRKQNMQEERRTELLEAEGLRKQQEFEAGAADRETQQRASEALQSVIGQDVRGAVQLQGPPTREGQLPAYQWNREPTPQEQASNLFNFLNLPGGQQLAAGGGPSAQRMSASHGDVGTLALQGRQQTTREGELALGEKELLQEIKAFALDQKKQSLAERRYAADMSAVESKESTILDEQGRERKVWSFFNKQTGAHLRDYEGPISEEKRLEVERLYDIAASSPDPRKQAVAQNLIDKEMSSGEGGTFIQSGDTVVGTGKAAAQAMTAKGREEMGDVRASLAEYEKSIKDLEQMTLGITRDDKGEIISRKSGAPLGAGAFTSKLFQNSVGTGKEVAKSFGNTFKGLFGSNFQNGIQVKERDKRGKEVEKTYTYANYFDSRVPKIERMANTIAFVRAATIFGQSGRALSQEEFKAAKNGILGGSADEQAAAIENMRAEIENRRLGIAEKERYLAETAPGSGPAYKYPVNWGQGQAQTPAPESVGITATPLPQGQAPPAAPQGQGQPQPAPTMAQKQAAATRLGITVEELERRMQGGQ